MMPGIRPYARFHATSCRSYVMLGDGQASLSIPRGTVKMMRRLWDTSAQTVGGWGFVGFERIA